MAKQTKQKDNSTLRHKAGLRMEALKALRATGASPVILETHGGLGRIFTECYQGVTAGAVFEKLPDKIDVLARQRPTWSVYEGTCEKPLAAGAASHLRFNFLDLDPYGSPFPVLAAIMQPQRSLADRLELVVNDGLRQKVQIGGAWSVQDIADIVARFGGNHKAHANYLAICRQKVRELAAAVNFELIDWHGYYCGHSQQMTHYRATLSR